jgi:hypothetical protein
MRELPILFSAPMVRAILEGRKTVTRRIVKPYRGRPIVNLAVAEPTLGYSGRHNDPESWGYEFLDDGAPASLAGWTDLCPYGQPGDRLWVRETWGYRGSSWTLGEEHKTVWIEYAADGGKADIQRPKDDDSGLPQPRDMRPDEDYVDDYYNGYLNRYWKQNRPSIHMPHWVSRITLEVTGVRVERLHDINEAGAMDEGVLSLNDGWDAGDGATWSPRARFSHLWEQINGPGSWDANPWVCAVEFRRIEQEKKAA